MKKKTTVRLCHAPTPQTRGTQQQGGGGGGVAFALLQSRTEKTRRSSLESTEVRIALKQAYENCHRRTSIFKDRHLCREKYPLSEEVQKK